MKKIQKIVGYHQVKLDDDSYGKLRHEREHLKSLGRHASYSDAFREIYVDALSLRRRE